MEKEPKQDYEEAAIKLAQAILRELLAEVGDGWNSNGIRIKLKAKIDSLNE